MAKKNCLDVQFSRSKCCKSKLDIDLKVIENFILTFAPQFINEKFIFY